jgi:hypothetical protein
MSKRDEIFSDDVGELSKFRHYSSVGMFGGIYGISIDGNELFRRFTIQFNYFFCKMRLKIKLQTAKIVERSKLLDCLKILHLKFHLVDSSYLSFPLAATANKHGCKCNSED